MADSVEEPLMRREAEEEVEGSSPDGDINNVSQLLEKNLQDPSIFVWLLTFSAGISGLLFGCKLKSTVAWNMNRAKPRKSTSRNHASQYMSTRSLCSC